MHPITMIFIAIGLSMDAFAVSVANGNLRLKHALRMALAFGVFQAIMPILGWFAGISVRDFVGGVDHWIAFAILVALGIKMMVESFKLDPKSEKKDSQKLTVLLMLSIATSIDALMVGISLSFLKVSILTPAIIIGVVTFVNSFIGTVIGQKLGHFFENKIEMAGGIVLIIIGIKILVEHIV